MGKAEYAARCVSFLGIRIQTDKDYAPKNSSHRLAQHRVRETPQQE